MSENAEMRWFLDLVDLNETERGDRLQQIEDPELKGRIRDLLDAHERAGSESTWAPPLHHAPNQGPDPALDESRDLVGQTIGQYRLLRRVASGGMGVVYEAEQDTPRRNVAIKVLRANVSRDIARRFEHEAEILGKLTHPGIAQVHEAGMAPTSQGPMPFLALEWIDGRPIDESADAADLDLRGRVQLLARVADAVAHAHTRGVIHRDLKPANILIDSHGQPKVLDFGIARLADDEAHSVLTQTGQVLGTLPYMSPEQVAGDATAIDTRTDVYALGVLGYQLLGGHLPIDVRGMTVIEAARTIREHEPALLGQLVPALRGDLETIIETALRKEPERRYATAAGLAEDLRRFIRHEPIAARPATTIYQLKKLVRRHRALCGGTLAVFAALAGGLVLTTIQRDRARTAEIAATTAQQEASTEAKRATRRAEAMAGVIRFIRSVLEQTSPRVSGSKTVDLEAAVGIATKTLNPALLEDPEVAGPIHTTIGGLWMDLGKVEQAEHHLQEALSSFEAAEYPNVSSRAQLHQFLANLAVERQQWDRAREELGTATALANSLGDSGRDHLSAILSDRVVLETRARDLDRALELAQQAVAETAANRGERSNPHARALVHLAGIQGNQLNWKDACQNLELALEIFAQNNLTTPNVPAAKRNLGWAYWQSGRVRDAVRMLEEAATEMRGIYSSANATFARTLHQLALIYGRLRQTAKAASLHEEALTMFEKVFEPPHIETEQCRASLGLCRGLLDPKSNGLEMVRQSVRAQRQLFAEDSLECIAAEQDLIEAHRRAGDFATAAELSEALIQRLENRFGKGSSHLVRPLVQWSYSLRTLGKMDRATAAMRRVVALELELLGPEHHVTQRYRSTLAQFLSQQGEHAEAMRLIQDSVAKLHKLLPPNNPNLKQLAALQASIEAAAKKNAAKPDRSATDSDG